MSRSWIFKSARDFSPTSLAGGGRDQLIRGSLLPLNTRVLSEKGERDPPAVGVCGGYARKPRSVSAELGRVLTIGIRAMGIPPTYQKGRTRA